MGNENNSHHYASTTNICIFDFNDLIAYISKFGWKWE